MIYKVSKLAMFIAFFGLSTNLVATEPLELALSQLKTQTRKLKSSDSDLPDMHVLMTLTKAISEDPDTTIPVRDISWSVSRFCEEAFIAFKSQTRGETEIVMELAKALSPLQASITNLRMVSDQEKVDGILFELESLQSDIQRISQAMPSAKVREKLHQERVKLALLARKRQAKKNSSMWAGLGWLKKGVLFWLASSGPVFAMAQQVEQLRSPGLSGGNGGVTASLGCNTNLQDDFAMVQNHIDRGGALSSSKSTSVYSSTRDLSGHAAKTKFIIKENQLTWLIHEYVAAQLYRHVLGSDLVGDVLWVCDKQNPSKHYVAIEFLETLVGFQASESIPTAGGVRFDCLAGGCRKSVIGGERAILTSLLFDEGDMDNGTNFALKFLKNIAIATRVDFDDSFKFLDREGISPGMTFESLSPQTLAMLKQGGMHPSAFLALVNGNARVYQSLKDSVLSYLPSLAGRIQPRRFYDAASELLQTDLGELDRIIDVAIDRVESIVSAQALAKNYKTTNAFARRHLSDADRALSLLHRVGAIIKSNIRKRFNELKAYQSHLYGQLNQDEL